MSGGHSAPRWAEAPFTVLDGGLSTVLEEMGERPGGSLWTAAALVDRPEVLVEAHRRYVEAGAEVVISASYQASVPGFERAGVPSAQAARLLASTTDLVRRAGAPVVACSVGPFGACLGDGSEYSGRYAAAWDDVRAFHRARLEVLVPTEPDVFAIETMPTLAEAEIVVSELRRLTAVPAWVSFTCVDEARTWGGDLFATAAAEVAPRVSAVGVNCTAPRLVAPLLRSARRAVPASLPFVAYPNHGAAWDAEQRCWVGPAGGLDIVALAPEWTALGARLIGGCCGVGPAAIRALRTMRDHGTPALWLAP